MINVNSISIRYEIYLFNIIIRGESVMKKYKVGYTTGVFDMFHIGHLNILKRAKEQCEFLIVGVSTDELVNKYKNKNPIIPFEDRIKIVESIKYVDKVVSQTDRNKINAYHEYNFNVMFLGDDWKGNEFFIKVESELNKYDCDVVFLSHTDGISSTILAQKISG